MAALGKTRSRSAPTVRLPPHLPLQVDAAVNSALSKLSVAQAAFETARNRANAALDKAKQDFSVADAAFNKARNDANAAVTRAQNDVNTAQNK